MPLSDCIDLRLSLYAISLLRAWMKESVSNVLVTSIWTALLVKHVKSALYIFKSDLFSLTVNGPSISTPQRVNGGDSMYLSFIFQMCRVTRNKHATGDISEDDSSYYQVSIHYPQTTSSKGIQGHPSSTIVNFSCDSISQLSLWQFLLL